MSVYSTAHYRDDAFQWVGRLGGVPDGESNDCEISDFQLSAANFYIEPFGDFPVPGGIVPGNLLAQYKREGTDIFAILCRKRKGVDETLQSAFKDIGNSLWGIHGIFKLAAAFSNKLSAPGRADVPLSTFIRGLFELNGAAAYLSGGPTKTSAEYLVQTSRANLESTENFIRDLVRLRGYSKSRSYRQKVSKARDAEKSWPKVPDRDLGEFRGCDVYAFPGATCFAGGHGGENVTLLHGDIERLERLVSGLAQCRFYGDFYGGKDLVATRVLKQAIARWQAVLTRVMSNVSQRDSNYVCRAFDVAYHIVVAQLSNDISNEAERCLREKWTSENLGRIVSLDELLSIGADLPPKERLEVFQQYRVLPQPDFDYFGAAYRQVEMYKEAAEQVRESGALKGEHWDNIMLYHRWLMVYAYTKRHHRAPGSIKESAIPKTWHAGYPNCQPGTVPWQDVNDIDFEGCFDYDHRGGDILDYVKDKALCPEGVKWMKDAEAYGKAEKWDKNQLLNWLRRQVPIDLSNHLSEWTTMDCDVGASDKAEAKKPFGRWFFLAKMIPRLLQTQYEASVTRYLEHVPWAAMSKSHADKVRHMNHITDPDPVALGTRTVFVSFDIAKWSPRIGTVVHSALDRQWADAFGVPVLASASRIFSEGAIHYIHQQIHHQFQKTGADFEGFAGKKLTLWHCAVMGYAVHVARDRNIFSHGARFGAFIDDGLLRADIPAHQYRERVYLLRSALIEVYDAASLKISWDKTLISEYWSTFLNEIRKRNRSVSPGIRTFLKITARAEGISPSLPDQIDMLHSTTSGAIKSGCVPAVAWSLLAIKLAYLLRSWCSHAVQKFDPLTQTNVLRAFVPVSHGGLGVKSSHQLSGSYLASTFEESLGNLKMIGCRFPDLWNPINAALNMPMRVMSDFAKAIAPRSIRRAAPTLVQNRAQILVERTLLASSSLPVISAALNTATVRGEPLVVHLAKVYPLMPIVVREWAWAADPLKSVHSLAAKFLRSRTALHFIRLSRLVRVTYANLREAEGLLRRSCI